ncbi:MAG: tetratricopeptide repeat protein [Burkholderiales bacterium]
MTRFFHILVALVFLGLSIPASAQSNDLQEISKLLRSGLHAQALDRVNQYLVGRPKDAQGRFLKGLILTEQNKTTEAIDILTALTKDFPELPEPYNNLAVLYASQGQYEKARQSLEQSIRTHPAYATAYENLGDVYTKLASQAYYKALQLDSSNTTAQTKLALMRDLVSSGGKPSKPGATRVAEPAKLPTPAPAIIAQAPTNPNVEAKSAAPKVASASDTKSATTIETKPTPQPPSTTPDGSDEIIKTVRSWAQAWSAKDVAKYLAFYAPGFKPPNGEARLAWEAERKRRISAPKSIEVIVDSPKTVVNSNNATITFRQNYRSDTLNVSSMKTLTMTRSNGKWLIQQERSGN